MFSKQGVPLRLMRGSLVGRLRRKPHLQPRSLTYMRVRMIVEGKDDPVLPPRVASSTGPHVAESNSASAHGPGRQGRLLVGSNWSWKKVAWREGTTGAGIRGPTSGS